MEKKTRDQKQFAKVNRAIAKVAREQKEAEQRRSELRQAKYVAHFDAVIEVLYDLTAQLSAPQVKVDVERQNGLLVGIIFVANKLQAELEQRRDKLHHRIVEFEDVEY